MNKSLRGFVSYFTGHNAEKIARQMLEQKGYTFVAQNVQPKRGSGACELDLVMLDKKTLVFVEVKKRTTTDLAAMSVLPSVQKRLYKGATAFLSNHPEFENTDCRFDVVCFDKENRMIHLENVIVE